MKTLVRRALAAPAFLLPLLLAGAPMAAQDEGEDAGQGEAAEGEDEAKISDDDEEGWFAVVGGDVHTGNGGFLRGATILARKGKIRRIGHELVLPEGTEVLDARGYTVYPGLVALNATSVISRGLLYAQPPGADRDTLDHLGENAGLEGAHVEAPEDDPDQDPYGPGELEDLQEPSGAKGGRSKVEDSFDPFSPYLVMALATGITSAEQSGAAIKLRRGEIDGVVMNERNLVSLTWSVQNPGAIRSLREKFQRAAEYLFEYREWEARGDKDEKEPSRKGVDSGALRILRGESLARFRAHDRADLLGIARFAQEYGFRPVIEGGREGWTVADELGRAGAYVVLVPRDRRPKDESLVRPGGSSIENAALLHAAGVQVAVQPLTTSFDTIGITGRDLLHLPVEAAFAVRGGLPEQAALEAMTVVPARILGVGHRVGTLEVGKDCDLIVTDGDLLHYRTFVQYAVVAGELVYDKEKELLFAHIRPRPATGEAEDDEDAGEEPEADDDEGHGDDDGHDDPHDDDGER